MRGSGKGGGDTADVALPLYQGVMIWQIHAASADYVRGATHSARWERRSGYIPWLAIPQFLMGADDANSEMGTSLRMRVGFRAIQNATNQRTMIATIIPRTPAGNSLGVISSTDYQSLLLPAFLCDFVYDYSLRPRMSQANLNWFILEETPVPQRQTLDRQQLSTMFRYVAGVATPNVTFAELWTVAHSHVQSVSWRPLWAVTDYERLRTRACCDAMASLLRGLCFADLKGMLRDCDHPASSTSTDTFTRDLYMKDFWRVDKDKDPELRHTVLTLIAFHDLESKVREHGGDRDAGIAAFLNQNHGEGWLLPETLRLADYGLGHDDRAQQHQPVASRLGPRFYDWQLAQTAEESWRECHLHARNLLGEEDYQELLADIAAERDGITPHTPAASPPPPAPAPPPGPQQGSLF